VLAIGLFRKQILITLRVMDCCAGEGCRRCVRPAVLKIKYYIELRKKEIYPCNKMKEG
jgi:hypothetical protein